MTDLEALAEVKAWVFDLDNTLYPRSSNLFSQIDALMTQYVVELTGYTFEDARRLQKDLYREHGTTLNGLMETRGIDPEHYLQAVHDIDYTPIAPHPELVDLIARLKGQKFIFTNADNKHAQAVLERLGGAELFDGMFDIKCAGYEPKPKRTAYEKCLETFDIAPETAAMFDDLERNLRVPHALGMRTIHVTSDTGQHDDGLGTGSDESPDLTHVHYTTTDLPGFLRAFLSR